MSKSKRLSDSSVRRLIVEALSRNDVSDAQLIVQNMVDMHEKAFALSHAVKASHLAAVGAFLEVGSDPFLKHQGRTALVSAILTDNIDCLKILLKEYLPLTKYMQTVKNERRAFARVKRGINEVLFESAAVCAVNCVEYLLSIGADCNTYYYHDDEFLSWCTPLIAACYGPLSTVCRGVSKQNATHTIQMLIEHGADLNKTNHLGDTALHWSCGAALVDIVRILLRNGADVNHQNKIGKTSLMTLAEMYKKERRQDFLEIIQMMIRHGADLMLTDTDGWMALHFAVESKFLDLVRLLLKGGADPNQGLSVCSSQDVLPCMSVLSLAVLHNSPEIVKLLLKWNACPLSDKYFPPFTFACEWQNLEMATLLYEAGVTNKSIIQGIDCTLGSVSDMNHGWQHLRELATSPTLLKLQSRTVIRRTLGRSLARDKLDLPLPSALILYLKLDM